MKKEKIRKKRCEDCDEKEKEDGKKCGKEDEVEDGGG